MSELVVTTTNQEDNAWRDIGQKQVTSVEKSQERTPEDEILSALELSDEEFGKWKQEFINRRLEEINQGEMYSREFNPLFNRKTDLFFSKDAGIRAHSHGTPFSLDDESVYGLFLDTYKKSLAKGSYELWNNKEKMSYIACKKQ